MKKSLYFCIMSTIIYPSPIFGPVHSRRLGVSLGVNLMPADGKVCSFDCVYCECGFNADYRPRQRRPTREEVHEALVAVLRQRSEAGEALDVITFAGNGEPTGHPDFSGIIDDTIAARDEYFPEAKVSVLSNATYINKVSVREALMKVDNNIQKLDTVDAEYIRRVDRPVSPTYDVQEVIDNLRKFNGHVIIQTMFMGAATGADTSSEAGVTVSDGSLYDNTSETFVAPWLEAVKKIAPQQVMIYTIDRETPDKTLTKASREVLDAIKQRVESLGIPCSASY